MSDADKTTAGAYHPDLRMLAPSELASGLRGMAEHRDAGNLSETEAALLRAAATYLAGATDSLREHMGLLREARAAAARWQPIEDVPPAIMHSADPVLLWSPETHTNAVYGRYWTQDEAWQEDYLSTPLRPTHWMPLPEPPHA